MRKAWVSEHWSQPDISNVKERIASVKKFVVELNDRFKSLERSKKR